MSNLWNGTLPPNRKKGVKRDKITNIVNRCNSIRSVQELIDEKYWDELAATQWHKNKRNWFKYIYDQDGVGSCAAESGTGLKAGLDASQNLPLIIYNPWSVYWYTSGGRDQGSVIGDNVEYLRDKGVCPEEVWPRSKGWRSEPNSQAKELAKLFCIVDFFYIETIQELVSALLQGFCIHAGYSGHAIVLVAYLGKGQLLFCNSWDKSWGDNGFGKLSLSSVYFPYGAYAYKNVIRWTPDQWKPKYNQEALGKAVTKFIDHTQTKYGVWGDRVENWREETYNNTLASCRLSV